MRVRRVQNVYEDEIDEEEDYQPRGGRRQFVQKVYRGAPREETVRVVRVPTGGRSPFRRAPIQQSRASKNQQFRQALGIGGRATQVVRQVERFEPSSSFLQRRVIKRGRGFNGV